jgi:hypothetical protein
MAVRIEKIIATVLHEVRGRQVEEVMDILAEGPEDVSLIAFFMVILGRVLHSRHTTRFIGLLSLCTTTFQGGSVASLALSPVRAGYCCRPPPQAPGRRPDE